MDNGNTESTLNIVTTLVRTALKPHLTDAAQKSAWRRIFENLPSNLSRADGSRPLRQPACRHLRECYDALRRIGGLMSSLGDAFEHLEPNLSWDNQNERSGSDGLADRYADAMIIGPDGLLLSEKIEIGISIMSPETVYPDHRHPAEEIYLALSEGAWRQENDSWHEPGVGGIIYNPPNILHAMRAKQSPFLAVWCLPLT